MLTGGQLSSLSTGAGARSPTACDFEPNSGLTRSPNDDREPEPDEPPNMLPPPHPASSAPATDSASVARRRREPAARIGIISLLGIIQKSPTFNPGARPGPPAPAGL